MIEYIAICLLVWCIMKTTNLTTPYLNIVVTLRNLHSYTFGSISRLQRVIHYYLNKRTLYVHLFSYWCMASWRVLLLNKKMQLRMSTTGLNQFHHLNSPQQSWITHDIIYVSVRQHLWQMVLMQLVLRCGLFTTDVYLYILQLVKFHFH